MTQQRSPFDSPELPNFVKREKGTELIEIELTSHEAVNNWVWPIGSWTVIIFNGMLALINIKDMWSDAYRPINHAAMTILFCLSLAALAIIYKTILRGR